MTSLTWLLLDFRSFIHKNHRSLEFSNWGSLKLLNFAGSRSPELHHFQTPELRRFQVSWTSPVSRLPNFVGSKSPELCQFSDSRTSQVPGLLNFTSFQSFSNRQQICELKRIRLLLSHIIRRSAKCMKFIRIASWVFPFHETELSIPMLIHEYTYEFGNSDVSRVKGFCPIPQH
jgi:hypothetical protein